MPVSKRIASGLPACNDAKGGKAPRNDGRLLFPENTNTAE
jgi:hypothetical protein